MLNVSNDFNEAYKNYEREIKMRIKIDGVMYTDHDISSFSVDYGSFMGNSFGIGSTFTNSMKLTLCKVVEGLKQLDEVVPEMGIVMPDKTVEYVPLGVFVISEEVNIDRNDNKTVIECSDRMILMNEPYESKLKYPAPIRDVALEIANLSGMEVDKTSFSMIKRDVIDEPKNYTYREALGLVAQFMAGYMTFNRNGLLTIRYLVDKDYRITPKEYMLKGLEKNEILFRPAGIEVRTGQNEEDIMTVGKQKGSVIKLENTVMRRLLLDDMYTRIKEINFYPYTLKWRGNPAVEVGDWLRVTDTKGNVFKVPNLSYRLEYRGGLIATSTVETVASNEVKMGYRGVLDQTIHYVNNILEDGTGNHIYYGVEKPEYPKEGDTWFKKNGPDTEIYIYQKIAEPDVFDWVLQISSAVDDTIKEAIEELEKDVQNAKDKADEVAVSLVEVQKDADEAKASAEQSKLDAQKALAENEVTKAEAQQAKEQSDQAIKDASSSMVTAKDALSKATENETSIGGLQVDIDKANNELKTKANQSDLNTLKGTVTNQQTQITQNATDIKTKAEKTYVDTINNKVDKQQTQINQNSESIKLKAEKQEVINLKNELDNLDIQERNYILESKKFKVGVVGSVGSDTTREILDDGSLYIKANGYFSHVALFHSNMTSKAFDDVEVGETLTFTMLMTTKNVKKQPYIYVGPSSGDYSELKGVLNKKFQLFSYTFKKEATFKLNMHFRGMTDGEYIIHGVKLTRGNRATDWTPAPEDMASADQVKDISASLEVQAGKIEMKADQVVVDNLKNTVDKQGTAITQNSEAIKLKAEKSQVDSLTGKVDKQQTEINQNAEQIKLKANQSTVNDIDKKVTNQQAQINLNSENIKLKAEKSEVTNLKNELDGLEIDQENLVLNSKGPFIKKDLNLSTKLEAGQYVMSFYLDLENGVKGSQSRIGIEMYGVMENDKTIYLGSWYNLSSGSDYKGYVNNIVELPSDLKTLHFFKVYDDLIKADKKEITKVSVRKGNKPLGWSPAPEDLATQSDVTKLEASIDVEAGKITNLTSSVNKNTTNIGKLTIESNKISSQVVELQNEEIGTDNLLLNSDFVDDLNKWEWIKDDKMLPEVIELLPTETKIVPSGKVLLIPTKGRNGLGGKIYQKVNTDFVKQSEKFTFSLYYADRANEYTVFKVYLLGKYNGSKSDKEFGSKQEIRSQQEFNRYVETVEVDTVDLKELHFVIETQSAYSGTIGQLLIQAPMLVVGSKTGDWGQGNKSSYSQITQLSNDILLRVQKGDVINQINVSTEGILIDGKKVHITGQTKIDNAVIKDAMIDSMTANKLTAGAINANEIAVINVKADNIVSGTLNGIYINLDKTMTVAENGQIVSSYNYGDDYGNAYNPRWFDGTSRYGSRYLNFLSNVYDVNSNNTRGKFRHYTETFVGSDLFKMRQYPSTSSLKTPISHLDITSDRLLAGKGWGTDISINFEKGEIYSSSYVSTTRVESSNGEFTQGLFVRSDDGLRVGRINALSNYNTLIINNKRLDLGDLELSKDSSGRRIQSYAVYSRTYGGGATVTVTDAGTLGRITSAAKYKLDIEDADTVMENAFKVLEINPRMWFDKTEVESIAEAMTNDELHELEADRQIRRHHGFVADEFHEKGLDEVVIYDSKGEIEGLSYDRISMYHNVILKRQQDEIESLKRQVADLMGGGKHE